MLLLILGIVLFLGIHVAAGLAPGLREAVIARGGRGLWGAAHGILSLLGLALIAYGYDASRATTGVLYRPPIFLSHITLTLMLIAFICLAAAFLPAGRIKAVTKFPGVLAVKIWAFAHLLANGETNSVILFSAFLIWGVFTRILLKRRWRAGTLVYPVFVSARYDVAAVLIAAVVYGLFVWKLHLWLIGVSPIVMG